MTYKQIAELLNGISETFDKDKLMKGDNIIGLKQSNFTDFIVLSCKQRKAYHWNQEANLSLVVHLLKLYIKLVLRYKIMRTYMPKVGTLGLDMMFQTCTVQVNLDFNSQVDMVRKFRAGLALQPI
ncbi:glutamate--cysteine ligase, chloroplastic-like [Camellia sinensis]|uniref:glutamate--cysteine ligase, chloroplastic-like n=1 Tax=Camellia sinensis TaxID=4442 RepID=UPI0010366391|nr:glutamate--cysteine ligase, chloroplastic-like [Camellia sinensis]